MTDLQAAELCFVLGALLAVIGFVLAMLAKRDLRRAQRPTVIEDHGAPYARRVQVGFEKRSN